MTLDTPKPYVRTQERHFSAHNMFLHAADLALEEAEKKEAGWFNQALVAIAFSAFAMEAFANALGDRVATDWKDFESASPLAKLRLLADRLSVPYAKDLQPWQSLRWLARLRNSLAHAKPQFVVHTAEISEEERADRPLEGPDSDLEKQVTIENARRAVNAMREIKLSLSMKIDAERRFGLYSDGWSSSTEMRDVT
jgi:hypothetical protein